MDAILFTDQLVRQGLGRDEIGRLRRRGELRQLRRGAYAPGDAAAASPREVHRQLIAATVPQLRANAVISHTSAAVLHGLPTWNSDLDVVHVTRPRSAGGGKRRSLVRLHSQPLTPVEVTEIGGVPVTSMARTVFDLARTCRYERAVAAGDKALASGMSRSELAELLERGRRWAGIRQARRLTQFIDKRAESPGESVSRVRIAEFGLPTPELQMPILLRDGRTVFGDFGWSELGTIGEFDGKIKYGELLLPGESAADAVVREKRREDQIRDVELQVVRWIWTDLYSFGPVAAQLQAAFGRGGASLHKRTPS